ncbi:MAG TPA: glycosyltransferase [Microbacterium sp.]|nr:glycosyltransferase [Microbacterium sp.]
MTHFGFLSTYPPTRCGLATFTEALAGGLAVSGARNSTVVRVLDEPDDQHDSIIVGRVPTTSELISGDRASVRGAIRALDATDVAIVQHEYGIYGGRDGEEVVELLRALETPAIVVLHTVLASPSAHQRSVLEAVCGLAAVVVVMTENAREILLRSYQVNAADVRVIPHGVPVAHSVSTPFRRASPNTAKRVVTWGLISAGKGLEWGIRAIAQLSDVTPSVEYVIAGQTHPKVLAHEGERYRESLQRLIDELGLSDTVTLDDRYLDARQLADLVATADVVLLPYDSRDQATSGVLVEAIAAGVPVVATGFPHAVELLAGGAGLIALHEDPNSIADSIRTIVVAEATRQGMHEAALRDTRATSWPVVAEQYRSLARGIAAARAA